MSWRFVRTPKWIIRHVAVVLLCAAMVVAMLWQISRLHEKQDHKRLVEARQEEPAEPVGTLLPASAAIGSEAVDEVLYRSVAADGELADDETIVVENRTYNGASGAWVLTPLRLDDGRSVLVNRGFIGFDHEGEIVAPPAPTGRVHVEGLVFPTQTRGSFGARDPEEGVLDVLARVDLARIDAQVPGDLLPAYVQLTGIDPPEPQPAAGAPELVLLGPPDLDDGATHRSYAVQWAIFTTIAAGGYVVLLRRVAKDQAGEQASVGA